MTIMYGLICDAINYCVEAAIWSGKISVYTIKP